MSLLQFITIGAFMGFTAGISPGPLLTLVISHSLKHNRNEGIKIALSPLITDPPIIIVTLLIFSKLTQFSSLLGVISFAGGIFVAYLGYESLKSRGLDVLEPNPPFGSLKKGVITNMLNPYPYLFWVTIGTPYILKAFDLNILNAILFIVSFYVVMVGSKIIIAIFTARSKKLMKERMYIVIMKLLGITLILFSILFFYDGIKYFRSS